MRGVSRTIRSAAGATAGRWLICVLTMAMMLVAFAAPCFAEDPANALVAIGMDATAAVPTVLIKTDDPVGYRYTIYDSLDPVRVVIDFPGMDATAIAERIPIGQDVLREIRVSNFDLASGTLARIEILLDKSSDYKVDLKDNDFRIAFAGLTAAPPRAEQPPEVPVAADQPQAVADAATLLQAIEVSPGKAVLSANAAIRDYEHFTLISPPRLVVDIFDVKPGFTQRVFAGQAGIGQVRVGTYPDKTRVVFDANGSALPDHKIAGQGPEIIVSWNTEIAAAPAAPVVPAAATVPTVAAPAEAAPAPQELPAEGSPALAIVEAIEFDSEQERSYVTLSLSVPSDVGTPIMADNLVRFDVKNATFDNPALRRTIDTSAFPTAVSSVTPYSVGPDVRVAVQLKDTVAYALEQDGTTVRLVIDDGAYAQASPPEASVVAMPAASGATAGQPSPEPAAAVAVTAAPAPASAEALVEPVSVAIDTVPAAQSTYSGQKISLVFDSADIRSILQLIGDVSELNILASDDVKGTITLRLIDVPWDQALDLVLETSDLGKIQQGNVLRIMPKSRLREMAQSLLTEQRQEIEEAVLESRVFQVSYSSVADIKRDITDLLTGRGSIIADPRNKQLIVKDVPSVLDEMAALIRQIDQPEKQVMIEARIVEANTNFSRDLGVKWGFNYQDDQIGAGSTFVDAAALGLGGSFVIPPPAAGSVGSAGGSLGLSFGTVGLDTLTMDMRLSALESAGEGKIVSTPRVTTLNGEKASISQGTKIPYTTVSDTGTETSFESAELKLEVTPEINPDGSVILQISASNSAVGSIVPTGTGNAISIDEKTAETKVLVRDGQTTVIGGIFVEDERDADTGVPFLKDIPFAGHLFKSTLKTKDRRELLIFITPRILE